MGNTAQKQQRLVGKQEKRGEENGTGSTFTCEHGEENGSGSSSSSFTCGICMETMSQEQKFKKKECSHSFCLDCMSKHILYMVRGRNAQVECPDVGCTKLLDPLSCRPILPVDTFVKWCEVICKAMAMQSPHSSCPFRRCSEMVLDECNIKGAVTKVQCPSCRRHFCFQCKVPWHEGHQCRGQERERNEELFNRLVKERRWKRCPKCSACVERTSGCPSIYCWCNNIFCYDCGGKFTKIHRFKCPLKKSTLWLRNRAFSPKSFRKGRAQRTSTVGEFWIV